MRASTYWAQRASLSMVSTTRMRRESVPTSRCVICSASDPFEANAAITRSRSCVLRLTWVTASEPQPARSPSRRPPSRPARAAIMSNLLRMGSHEPRARRARPHHQSGHTNPVLTAPGSARTLPAECEARRGAAAVRSPGPRGRTMYFARRIGWALALLISVGAVAAQAQNGTVTGRVTNLAGNSISGAEVRVEGTSNHTLTDTLGRYELKDVAPGQRQIRVLLMGFQSQMLTVAVTAGGVATLDFKLAESVLQLPGVEVVVGSRARHTAADELAVPVDVYDSEVLLRQGSTETSQALQSVSPSVNFPRQSVTDATDVVRPFTLRGLSPDHTLVLVNNMRRHQTALVNTFAYGTAAGSSGVDMNAIPASAIDRVEVLRDGAAAQYGSDAIAGVVNVVTRKGKFRPFASVTGGQYFTNDYDRDGGTINVSGGWGLPLLWGSLVVSAEYLDRQPTNRAWADPFDASGTGVPDVVGPDGKVIQKNNPVPQPNQHWGDGLERDLLTFASAHLPLFTQQLALYATGSYSFREGNGNGYRRYGDDSRNWTQIYPIGFLPEFRPKVTDYS